MSQPIEGQDGHIGFFMLFRSARKTQNLVEDVDILLLIRFHWIPFSGFIGEVQNVSANQRLGRQSCFFDLPEKHTLGRGHWNLVPSQVSLNSVKRFQRSRKCLSQSETRAGILFFISVRKIQTWSRTLRSCILSSFVELRSAVSEEKSKMWSLRLRCTKVSALLGWHRKRRKHVWTKHFYL